VIVDHHSFPRLSAILLFAVFARAPIALAADILDPVRNDIIQGQADDAIKRLRQILGSNNQNGDAHNLYCRVSLQLDAWDDAVDHCERAVNISQENSSYHLWLGRAYGAKAERASMFSAYGLARKLKSEFESAVRLDPRNAEALADLGEFYVSAPAVVGGGNAKAEALAPKLDAVDPVRGHELRAQLADSEKNYAAAESELKAAISASHSPADQWMGLASYYRKHERWDDMMQAIKTGLAADKAHTVAQVDGASTLIRTQKELQLAVQMLRDYIASSQKSEDAPAFRVHVELGKLLAKQGDQASAKSEFQAALALAHDYKPAASLLASLGH
jgi:tetratricopeptide (TPR) repeat protein